MAVEIMTGPEVAEYLRLPSVRTLYQWRYLSKGPKGSRVGRHLRYRKIDVDAWLDEQATGGNAA